MCTWTTWKNDHKLITLIDVNNALGEQATGGDEEQERTQVENDNHFRAQVSYGLQKTLVVE